MTVKQRRFLDYKAEVVTAGFAVVVFSCMYLALIPACQRSCHRPRSPCQNNLKSVGLALHNYATDLGSFPPAVVRDANGRLYQGWRTLLLPYLESPPEMAEYRTRRAWNDPRNRRLVETIPDVYRCAIDAHRQPTETSAVAVTGPGFLFDGTATRRFEDILDGTSHTIMAVEMADTGLRWYEPRDVSWDEFVVRVEKHVVGRHRGGGFHILMVDGGVKFLQYANINREALHAAFTIAGRDDSDPVLHPAD